VYAGGIDCVNGNFQVLTVCLFNDRRKFRKHVRSHPAETLIKSMLLGLVLPNRVARSVCSVDQQEFLLTRWHRKAAGFQILDVFTLRDQLTSRSQDLL